MELSANIIVRENICMSIENEADSDHMSKCSWQSVAHRCGAMRQFLFFFNVRSLLIAPYGYNCPSLVKVYGNLAKKRKGKGHYECKFTSIGYDAQGKPSYLCDPLQVFRILWEKRSRWQENRNPLSKLHSLSTGVIQPHPSWNPGRQTAYIFYSAEWLCPTSEVSTTFGSAWLSTYFLLAYDETHDIGIKNDMSSLLFILCRLCPPSSDYLWRSWDIRTFIPNTSDALPKEIWPKTLQWHVLPSLPRTSW